MKIISDSTKVTLSIVIILLGGVGYVTAVAFQGNANAAAIETIQKKSEKLDQIAMDVAVIKNDIESIKNKLDQ